MITDKKELLHYLEADKKALGRKNNSPRLFDYTWKYEIALRKYEYYSNCQYSGGVLHKFLKLYWKYRWNALGIKCGYTIDINCIEEGLSIAHIGTIVINGGARIGKNLRIHVCTNIGTKAGSSDEAPIIGDDCYIGPGAKLFGPIVIGKGVAVGANSVVNKSFEMDNVSIAGIPARIISEKGTKGLIAH